jgi:cobalt-zinc-cadmium efflux system outer membrane protein
MRVAWRTLALAGAILATSRLAAAQTSMTLAEALARARDQAPRIISARLAIEEARGRLAGATHGQLNPEVDFGLGNRQEHDTRSTDLDLGFSQAFEPSGRRSAREAMATAGIEESQAQLEDVTRVTLRATAVAFVRALHLAERIRLLERTSELATNILQIAERRFRAGDIAVLDVNISRASLARVRAEIQGATAERAIVVGELKELVQVEGDLEIQGDLKSAGDPQLTALLVATANLPEVRSLGAAIRQAEAEGQFGQSFRRADYGFGVRYQREGGDQIVLGGLTLTLPWSSKGQEPIAVGLARANRLKAELNAALVRARIEVQSAFEAYQRRSAAVGELERDAFPSLDENDALATRSFEVGQLGLVELLLIRREILDTRFQYLDALLEAALARVEVDARAGVLR